MPSFSEAFVSIFITKLDYNKSPEKDNSTDSRGHYTNGKTEAITCFSINLSFLHLFFIIIP